MTTDTTTPQTETTTDDEPLPEGFQLRQTGRIAVWWPGFQTIIERPKIGQFRQLRELFADLSVEGTRTRARLIELQTEAGDKETSDERLAEIQAETDRLDDDRARRQIDWFAEVNKRLGSSPLPTVEDGSLDYDALPIWLGNSQISTAILQQWRNVPLAPGGKAK